MSLNETPSANRLHIGIFGKVNSGKSSFLNAFTGQDVSIVSNVAGTTTDVVTKAMEIAPLGACVLIDTPGFDDTTILGEVRKERTRFVAEKCDIAVLVFAFSNNADDLNADISQQNFLKETYLEENFLEEKEWFAYFQKKKIPVVVVVNEMEQLVNDAGNYRISYKIDTNRIEDEKTIENGEITLKSNAENEKTEKSLKNNIENNNSKDTIYEKSKHKFLELIQNITRETPIVINAKTGENIERVKEALIPNLLEDFEVRSITGDFVKESDVVLLVMPQDIQAPKGRLILPQVQTIRDLLDKKCIVMSVTTDKMQHALEQLKQPPKLIITDSQVFKTVYELKPKESMLTSFSILFAAYKGDLPYYIEGAKVIDTLNEQSKVLIAECCTHAPLSEDIGRVKIPNMLKKRFGQGLSVDMVSGTDFPNDLREYDLIIQCGGCMFNRKYVLSRIDRAKEQGVSMTNYGVTIAHLTGILDKSELVLPR